MENSVNKKIVCRFCGGEYDEMEPKCPYCDSTNYQGAEAEYFEKLEEVRSDMEELEEIPQEETERVFRKQGRFLVRTFLIIGGIFLLFALVVLWSDSRYKEDVRADYLWKEKNFPYMNELYEQGKYEELIAFYFDDSNADAPVWDWEHSEFCETYDELGWLNWYLGKEQEGEQLTKDDYVSILYYELDLMALSMRDADEQTLAYYAEDIEAVRADFEERFQMSEEDYKQFMSRMEHNGGWIGYTECEDYIKTWYKER